MDSWVSVHLASLRHYYLSSIAKRTTSLENVKRTSTHELKNKQTQSAKNTPTNQNPAGP